MLIGLTALGLAAAGVGCSDGESSGQQPKGRPEHVINEQKVQEHPYKDDPVLRDVPTLLRTTDVLPDLDIRALRFVGKELYAGGASKVMRLGNDGKSFQVVLDNPAGPVVDMTTDGDALVVAYADRLVSIKGKGQPVTTGPFADTKIQAVVAQGTEVYVATDKGLAKVENDKLSTLAGSDSIQAKDLALVGGELWAATSKGLVRYDPKNAKLVATLGKKELGSDDIRALAVAPDGSSVVVGTAAGVAVYDPIAKKFDVRVPGKREGIPNGDVLSVAVRKKLVLSGHGIGATAMEPSHKDHYHSKRWIPDERVTAVALGEDGTRWLGTSKGIGKVTLQPRTLAQHQASDEPLNDRQWRMDGFVACEGYWDDEWDHSAKPHLRDSDNDGLWTEMQIAAWCFAYATTGDEAYYQKAHKAMNVMLMQVDVPALTFEAKGMQRGFITRSLVREDEGSVFEDKKTRDNWHLQEYKGKKYYWKDDTSSDEYAGHFFGIPVYYDLCAKEDEKERIRQHVHDIMSYVVDNDYYLIDLDGKPTKYGVWAGMANAVDGLNACFKARHRNCFKAYGGGGWLNSIEVMGMLLASWHITGDDRFYDEYERLTVDERYGEMVPVKESTVTVTNHRLANHSDHELASIAYYTLLRYEPNPERRKEWIKSLRKFYEYEYEERNALEIAVMTSAIPDADVDRAALTLIEMPTDWRTWRYDNSHRKDNRVSPQADRHGAKQFDFIFPYDEIRTMKWNGSPYEIQAGSTGKQEQAPWPFLLPYWMMRYYHAIEAGG